MMRTIVRINEKSYMYGLLMRFLLEEPVERITGLIRQHVSAWISFPLQPVLVLKRDTDRD